MLTCSTRDDLPDGGAEHFAKTVRAIRRLCPGATVETLISDMKMNTAALDIIAEVHPDVINHNVETVKELQKVIRPQADYERSLNVLRYFKQKDETLLTKTGFMVGLGETEEQIDALSRRRARHRLRHSDHRPVSSAHKGALSSQEICDSRGFCPL